MHAIKKGLRRPRRTLQLSENIPTVTTEKASVTLAHTITMPINLGLTPTTSVQKGSKYTLATREAQEIALPKEVRDAILALPIRCGCLGATVVEGVHTTVPFAENAGATAVVLVIESEHAWYRSAANADFLEVARGCCAMKSIQDGGCAVEGKRPEAAADRHSSELSFLLAALRSEGSECMHLMSHSSALMMIVVVIHSSI
jgi:hypothetical protein